MNDGETPTLERAKFTSFSQPYARFNLVLFGNRLTFSQQQLDSSSINRLDRPQYQKGYCKIALNYVFLKEIYPVVPYMKIDQAINDVVNGKLLAVFLDQPHMNFWLLNHAQGTCMMR